MPLNLRKVSATPAVARPVEHHVEKRHVQQKVMTACQHLADLVVRPPAIPAKVRHAITPRSTWKTAMAMTPLAQNAPKAGNTMDKAHVAAAKATTVHASALLATAILVQQQRRAKVMASKHHAHRANHVSPASLANTASPLAVKAVAVLKTSHHVQTLTWAHIWAAHRNLRAARAQPFLTRCAPALT